MRKVLVMVGMKRSTAITGVILLQVVLLVAGQTYQYSRGWTNGKKRSIPLEREIDQDPLNYSSEDILDQQSLRGVMILNLKYSKSLGESEGNKKMTNDLLIERFNSFNFPSSKLSDDKYLRNWLHKILMKPNQDEFQNIK